MGQFLATKSIVECVFVDKFSFYSSLPQSSFFSGMKSVFMVAEKPSLAASLAKLLSDGKSSQKKGKTYFIFRIQ